MEPNTLKLSEADRRRDVGHAIIVSDHRKPIASLRIHALTPKLAKANCELVVVGRAHSPFPRGDDLVSEEAEGSAGAMPADTAAFVAGANRFGCVLDHEQPVLAGEIKYRIKIYRV